MNNLLEKLKYEVGLLNELLSKPEPGLMTWNEMVGGHWKRIVELWDPPPGTGNLQRDLVEGLRAAVPQICMRCHGGQPISRTCPDYHSVVNQFGIEIGLSNCKAVPERALLARADAEMSAQAVRVYNATGGTWDCELCGARTKPGGSHLCVRKEATDAH